MKKIFFALMTIAMVAFVGCDKDDDSNTSLDGRWEAARFSDQPDDIAFVSIFNGDKMDLYIVAWGQHYVGTYTLANDQITFHITDAYQAYTDVTFDDEGNIDSYSWFAGNLDAKSLSLNAGYDWYSMKQYMPSEYANYTEELAKIAFKVNGDQAESNINGIEGLIFKKVK